MTIDTNENVILDDLKELLLSNKNIGILVSGGLDSGLVLSLLHLLRQELKLDNNFTVFTVPKYDGAKIYAEHIVDFVRKKFNSTLPMYIVGNKDEHHSNQIVTAVVEIISKYPIDVIVSASTLNPKELPGGPDRIKSTSKKFHQTFLRKDLTKVEVIKLIFKFNLHEIISLSHSCTEQPIGRCLECWQCQERIWAFNQSGYEDTGSL